MRKRFISPRLVWRSSWILLVPLLAVFAFWAFHTWDRYMGLAVKTMGDSLNVSLSLRDIGAMEFRHFLGKVKLDVERAVIPGETAPLENVALYVGEGDINRLNANLPVSGQNYIRGGIVDNGHVRKVKVKYRGDFPVHWGFYKKSWRVKTKKSRFYHGLREFNLIVPKTETQFGNYVGYEAAREMGLITPRHRLVTMTLNGRNQGLYLLVEQIDETTLRDHRLIPGDIYVGDQAYGSDRWSGIDNNVFDHPGVWDKAAVDNHYPESHRVPLRDLLEAIEQMDTAAGQARIEELVDLDAFARFNLLEVFSVSGHFDQRHNWKLYYDPQRHKFYPIVWDPMPWYPYWQPGGQGNLWKNDKPPAYLVASKLMRALHHNANFLRTRNAVFEDYFKSDAPDRVVALMKSLREKLAPVIEDDPGMLDDRDQLLTPESVMQHMQAQVPLVQSIIDAQRRYYVDAAPSVKYHPTGPKQLLVSVEGWRNIAGLDITLADASDPGRVALAVDGPDGEKEVDITALVNRDGNRMTINQPLSGALHWLNSYDVTKAPAVYKILFTNPVDVDRIDARLAGQRLAAVRDDALAPRPFTQLHRTLAFKVPSPPQVWQGEVTIRKSQVFETPVTIEAGSHIRLGAGVTLKFHGQLNIEGTAAAPVVIDPLDEAPWGAFILQGAGARGSTLRHFEMSDGSGFKDDLHNYTGMLSIHDTGDIAISDCHLHDNKLFDDMFHIVYADVTVDRCLLENAFSDAIDLDMSAITVTDTQFINSGNDGLDLMGTRAIVRNDRFEGGKDKGISVGERSEVWATHSDFVGNAVGVQSKDNSIAVIRDSSLERNGLALHAYKKNWRYDDGGHGYYCNDTFSNNAQVVKFDKHSHFSEVDCGALGTDPAKGLDKLRQTLTER